MVAVVKDLTTTYHRNKIEGGLTMTVKRKVAPGFGKKDGSGKGKGMPGGGRRNKNTSPCKKGGPGKGKGKGQGKGTGRTK